MKKLILLLVMTMIMGSLQYANASIGTEETTQISVTQDQQQENIEQSSEKLPLFQRVKKWAVGGLLAAAVGLAWAFIRKKGWALKIKFLAGKGSIVFKEIGEACFAVSDTMSVVDKSIRDDGSLVQNSVEEVVKSGKKVVVEMADVILTFSPKK